MKGLNQDPAELGDGAMRTTPELAMLRRVGALPRYSMVATLNGVEVMDKAADGNWLWRDDVLDAVTFGEEALG